MSANWWFNLVECVRVGYRQVAVILLVACLPACGPLSLDQLFLVAPQEVPILPSDLAVPFEPFDVLGPNGETIRGWWIPIENARGTVIISDRQGTNQSTELANGMIVWRTCK